jgi:hypothetical protein
MPLTGRPQKEANGASGSEHAELVPGHQLFALESPTPLATRSMAGRAPAFVDLMTVPAPIRF